MNRDIALARIESGSITIPALRAAGATIRREKSGWSYRITAGSKSTGHRTKRDAMNAAARELLGLEPRPPVPPPSTYDVKIDVRINERQAAIVKEMGNGSVQGGVRACIDLAGVVAKAADEIADARDFATRIRREVAQ